MSERKVAEKSQYQAKYTHGKVYNGDWVNCPLLDHYKAKRRSQRSLQMQTWSNQRNLNAYHC